MIADRVDDEQNSTVGTADGLKSNFVLMAGVAPFDHWTLEYEARKTEIKPPLAEILVAFGAVPYEAIGAEGSPYSAEVRWHAVSVQSDFPIGGVSPITAEFIWYFKKIMRSFTLRVKKRGVAD